MFSPVLVLAPLLSLLGSPPSEAPVSAATQSRPAGPTPLAVGDVMPKFRLKVANPELAAHPMVDLGAWFGDKAASKVLVTFAASWCKPCRKELTDLHAAREALSKAGVRVVVVVSDAEEKGREEMLDWLRGELGSTFYLVADDWGIVRTRYRASELPATFIGAANGVLTDIRRGYDPKLVSTLL